MLKMNSFASGHLQVGSKISIRNTKSDRHVRKYLSSLANATSEETVKTAELFKTGHLQ
jgi:hypothetical protein